jgi:pimeloyl-ACP methyl ester carboxylesterase
MPVVSEHNEEIDGMPIFWRSAEPPDATAPAAPVLYVHGVPTSSHIWLPFLERSGGIAVDLPGFGRSAKPGYISYAFDWFDGFIERFLEHVGVGSLRLVVQDWGAVALQFAQRFPERIERLVVIDSVPLLPGYRWHRIARVWRTLGLGELAMGATTPRVTRLLLREAFTTPGPVPEEFVAPIIAAMDQGTQRAILRLYRSADPQRLAAAGQRLNTIDAPALVVWGERDPYVPARFGDAYADALPNAQLLRLPDAGHWCWLDRPDVVDRVVEFVGAA